MGWAGKAPSAQWLKQWFETEGAYNRDASGIALIDSNGKGIIAKAPMKGKTFWEAYQEDIVPKLGDAVFGIAHVRKATHGRPENNANNHPIVLGKNAIIAHNGIVRPPKWLPATGECDSEQLGLYFKDKGPEALKEFIGFAAFLYYSKGILTAYRWMAPLYISKFANTVFFTQYRIPQASDNFHAGDLMTVDRDLNIKTVGIYRMGSNYFYDRTVPLYPYQMKYDDAVWADAQELRYDGQYGPGS